jgi:predicted transcriptional regulator
MKIHDIAFHRISDFPAAQIEQTRHYNETLIVNANQPAYDAIEVAQKGEARLIFVVDDNDTVSGIVAPSILKQKIETYRGTSFGSLLDAIRAQQEDPQF